MYGVCVELRWDVTQKCGVCGNEDDDDDDVIYCYLHRWRRVWHGDRFFFVRWLATAKKTSMPCQPTNAKQFSLHMWSVSRFSSHSLSGKAFFYLNSTPLLVLCVCLCVYVVRNALHRHTLSTTMIVVSPLTIVCALVSVSFSACVCVLCKAFDAQRDTAASERVMQSIDCWQRRTCKTGDCSQRVSERSIKKCDMQKK